MRLPASKKDSKGRIIAEIADYSMAREIVEEAFRENMGAQDKKTEKYLEAIKEKERITPGNLAKKFGVSGSAISGWLEKRIRAGMIEWVDESGYHFVDDKALKKAKHQGTAHLKVMDTYQNETVRGLPTPFDLTGGPRWDEGGDLLELYDLDLEKRASVCRVFLRHEAAQEMRVGPSEPTCKSSFQTTLSCSGQMPG